MTKEQLALELQKVTEERNVLVKQIKNLRRDRASVELRKKVHSLEATLAAKNEILEETRETRDGYSERIRKYSRNVLDFSNLSWFERAFMGKETIVNFFK